MSESGSAAKGFLLVVLMHVVSVTVLLMGARSGQAGGMTLLLFGIGLTQLAYVVPLILWARSRGERRTVKGILIAAGVTLLLNGACFAFVVAGGIRIGG